MKQKSTNEKRIRFAKMTALVSFTLGTILFVFHFLLMSIFGSTELLVVGYFYVVIAFIFNAIMLASLIVDLIIYKNMRIKTFKALGAVLLNVPIAYVYYIIVVGLL